MSGRKRSSYSLDNERERRNQLISQIDSVKRELSGISRQMEEVLYNASDGVRQHFASEVRETRQWLDDMKSNSILARVWGASSASPDLSSGLSTLQHLVQAGSQVRNRLIGALVSDAGRLRSVLKSRLAYVEGKFGSAQELLSRWLDDAEAQRLGQTIGSAIQAIQADAFSIAEQQLDTIEEALSLAIGQAEKREAEHIRQEQAHMLASLRRQVTACAGGIQQMLNSTSEGLRHTFPQEVERARQWLRQSEQLRDGTDALNENSAVERINTAIQNTSSMLNDGRESAESIRIAFTERADEMRRQAEARLAGLEVIFNGGRELLANWRGEDEIAKLEDATRALRDTFCKELYGEIEIPATTLGMSLETAISEAEALETRHQRRICLFQALRKVCQEMHFREVEPPQYEVPGKRGSRIVYVVDTLTHGRTTFYVSLDSIETDSLISKTNCGEEFRKLSEKLANRFGVRTKFEMADPNVPPIRINSIEQEEPGGATQSMEQG